MLIEVGTGVIASKSEMGWNEVWKSSPERRQLLERIDKACGSRPSENYVDDRAPSFEFAASTYQQCLHLTHRVYRQYWRTPEYPYSRLYASFLHALLNGFTFFQLSNSARDLQSRAFSAFLALMLVPEFVNACSVRFHLNRQLWMTREHPSRIYGWFAFCTAQIVPEIPFAFLGAVVYYALFYFPVGFPAGEPAGYAFLMVILFHLFSTSWGQWITALTDDYAIAANIIPFFLIMCETFNGILRPYGQIPAFWRYTMYYLDPFTYWIGGILSAVLEGVEIQCKADELSRFLPRPGETCAEYAGEWISRAGGYLVEIGSGECGYCKYESGDKYLRGVNVNPGVAWRNMGIFCIFVVANWGLVYLIVWGRNLRK
jgi:ATP-binding cassette subfamily G (WHITE) protein 2 (SNQ2)